jgi:hypothetical protein
MRNASRMHSMTENAGGDGNLASESGPPEAGREFSAAHTCRDDPAPIE